MSSSYHKMDSKDPQDIAESTSGAITYAIPGLEFQHGPFAFTYISYFLSFITPHDLPFELIHNILYANVDVMDVITEALKIESGFMVIMTIFVILSLVPLGTTVAWCCKRKPIVEEQDEPIDPLMVLDDSHENVLICRKKASFLALFVIFSCLILGDVILFLTNSALSQTLDTGPDIVKASIHDVEEFLKDTHVQIKKSLDNGFDTAIKNVINDLDDIDILLGEPIRSEVSSNTGIELAFDSLAAISSANIELINRVLILQETVTKSLKISQEAANRMEELQIQLSVLQRQCTFARDRPLCDTLRIRSFEENGLIDALKTLQEDQSIFKMRYLGELEVGTTVKNLSIEVSISRSIFGNFPTQVKSDTLMQRNDTIEQLELIKSRTTTMAQMLTQTITSLLDQLSGTWEAIEPHYETVHDISVRLWGLAWTTSMTILFVLIFMSATFCCNWCNSKVKTGVLLVTSICAICVASVAVMLFGVFTLAIGGNGEIILCRPLYDDQYIMLEKLFDKPGLFYSKELYTIHPYNDVEDLYCHFSISKMKIHLK